MLPDNPQVKPVVPGNSSGAESTPILGRVRLPAQGLRQRDGVTCGPAVAVMAGALLDPAYGTPTDAAWFAAEQVTVHAAANRLWPRALGTTPWGMASAISRRGARRHVRYGWRLRRRRDSLVDVERAVRAHWPVAMLIGNAIPRHWVLLVACDDSACDGETFDCYEPSSGAVLRVSMAAVRAGRLRALGFPRAFLFVLPTS